MKFKSNLIPLHITCGYVGRKNKLTRLIVHVPKNIYARRMYLVTTYKGLYDTARIYATTLLEQ